MGVVKRITYPGDGVKDDCEMLDMKTHAPNQQVMPLVPPGIFLQRYSCDKKKKSKRDNKI